MLATSKLVGFGMPLADNRLPHVSSHAQVLKKSLKWVGIPSFIGMTRLFGIRKNNNMIFYFYFSIFNLQG